MPLVVSLGQPHDIPTMERRNRIAFAALGFASSPAGSPPTAAANSGALIFINAETDFWIKDVPVGEGGGLGGWLGHLR